MMRICRSNGWTLKQWDELGEDEQIEWRAYDTYRQEHIEGLRTEFMKKRPSKSDPTKSYSNWTPEVAALLYTLEF